MCIKITGNLKYFDLILFSWNEFIIEISIVFIGPREEIDLMVSSSLLIFLLVKKERSCGN